MTHIQPTKLKNEASYKKILKLQTMKRKYSLRGIMNVIHYIYQQNRLPAAYVFL